MVQWHRIGDTTETKVGWRTVTRKHYRFPNGKEFPFDVIGREGEETAAIVALTPDNQVIISEQYRPGPDQSMNELPGGVVDASETPQQAAVRELLEETGYKPKKVALLGSFYPEAYLHLKQYYFIGYDCEKVTEPAYEDTEYITVKMLSIADFLRTARNGGTTDGFAAFLAYDQLKELQRGTK